jgi:dolichol-phosphate mannosyltransferase
MPVHHLIAIPVFNEETYVDRVLDEVRRYSRDILVVDDGSTDGTSRRLQERDDVRVITHLQNRGYGKSVSDAFCFARRHGFDWLITMDCDEQHVPSRIPAFLDAGAADDADVISGTRYPAGHRAPEGVPPDRLRINRLVTDLLNRMLGLGITDAFCGFKAYRVSALRHIEITVPGYAMPMQFWVQAARAGLRIRELAVPLIYKDPNRHFGGLLDDPQVRLQHYVDVLEAELAGGAPIQGGSPAICRKC